MLKKSAALSVKYIQRHIIHNYSENLQVNLDLKKKKNLTRKTNVLSSHV